MIAYAAEIGLDVERFTAELDDRRHQEAVNEDFRRAVAAGIKLPPTLFINGVPYEGGRTAEELRARIVAVELPSLRRDGTTTTTTAPGPAIEDYHLMR